jgi:3D (Asp-Asp-Asp) domain-containing protein
VHSLRGCLTLCLLCISACAHHTRVPATPAAPSPKPAASPHAVEGSAFVATAYCQRGTTASGAHTATGIVAADPDVLPLGTRIRVSGLTRGHDGVYHVMDTGTRVRGRRIDVYMESCGDAKRFGTQRVRVAIVK